MHQLQNRSSRHQHKPNQVTEQHDRQVSGSAVFPTEVKDQREHVWTSRLVVLFQPSEGRTTGSDHISTAEEKYCIQVPLPWFCTLNHSGWNQDCLRLINIKHILKLMWKQVSSCLYLRDILRSWCDFVLELYVSAYSEHVNPSVTDMMHILMFLVLSDSAF